jgi:hypothetical protein
LPRLETYLSNEQEEGHRSYTKLQGRENQFINI